MADDKPDQKSVTLFQQPTDQLLQFEQSLIRGIESLGLPIEGILVPVSERGVVLSNVSPVVSILDQKSRATSIYISKFLAAVASGLFDAALNYLWDETIAELRKRVAQYDLSYFYDNAVSAADRRKSLSTEADLDKITDAELIQGAKGIGLISDIGFKHLDFIKYMRNWASAAHPNQNEITGLQLVSWLQTCIKEVISLPLSSSAIEVKKLLGNIRVNSISPPEAKQVSAFFKDLSTAQMSNLASGFFGIYCRQDTSTQARTNIRLIAPYAWPLVPIDTKQQFGIKHARFAANNDQAEALLAREFLDAMGGLEYLTEDMRIVEIDSAIDHLISNHRGYNNFHNEPTPARELSKLVGDVGKVPIRISNKLMNALVEAYLTNGHGEVWAASPIYERMIEQASPMQADMALISFAEDQISSKLQFELCRGKFHELLAILESRVTNTLSNELIDAIRAFTGPLDRMHIDTKIRGLVDGVRMFT